MRAEATVIPAKEAFLYHARMGTRSVTVAELDPAFTGIVVPVAWSDPFVLNGQQVRDDSIYLPEDKTLFQAIGSRRETLGIALPREELVSAVAALRGVEPDDVRLAGGAHRIEMVDLAMMRRHLRLNLNLFRGGTFPPGAESNPAESLMSAVLESVLHLVVKLDDKSRGQSPALGRYCKIVRNAENRFAAAEGQPVSLADLCAATNASQGTLNHAFRVVCGSSPIQYFKKRRLTDARLALLGTNSARGKIKRAALEAGFMHFSRFATEYRHQFGESPSLTLNRSPS